MVAFPNPPQSPDDSHYKQMWAHERNRRIEVEQENIRLRKIVYNTKFSINERAIALEIAEQVKEARHVDEQGRKLFSEKVAAERLGLNRGTIATGLNVLKESGYVKDKETKPLRDKDGKVVKGKSGMPITPIHLEIDQDLYEDFSKAERSAPRKIKDARKKPTCQKCGSKDVTVKTEKTIICGNPNCKHETIYEDPTFEHFSADEPAYSAEILDTIQDEEEAGYSAEILDTKNLLDYSAEILDTIGTEDESNNPPRDVPSPADHLSTISDWLEKRRGTPRIIQATGKLEAADKYISKSETFEPDLAAYIQGKIGHIYGSWLRNADGKTSILSFDCDTPEHNDQVQNYLLDLARAGGSAIYWQRQRERGHLEIYFDAPVDPEAARLWAIEICPDLEEIPECFPCDGIENRTNHALSWPLYQRIGGTVHACKAYAMLPSPHEAGMQEVDPTDLEALASLITLAVTPVQLVEEFAVVLDERKKLQSREQDDSERTGGVIGIKPKPITQVQSDRDLAKRAIADFNRSNRIEDMVKVGRDGKFPATWRGERTASVHLDKSGDFATDHGKNGSFPRILDAYEVYCLINDINKKADLAKRCDDYRRQHTAPGALEEVVMLPSEKHQGPVYVPCLRCGTLKTVKRADGAYTCGTDHSEEG